MYCIGCRAITPTLCSLMTETQLFKSTPKLGATLCWGKRSMIFAGTIYSIALQRGTQKRVRLHKNRIR